MASREERICDACADRGDDKTGYPVYLGFAKEWWLLDLCEADQDALLGELVALLDTVGAPVQGPALKVAGA